MVVRKIMQTLELENFSRSEIQEFCFAYLETVAQDNDNKVCEEVLCSIKAEFNRFDG